MVPIGLFFLHRSVPQPRLAKADREGDERGDDGSRMDAPCIHHGHGSMEDHPTVAWWFYISICCSLFLALGCFRVFTKNEEWRTHLPKHGVTTWHSNSSCYWEHWHWIFASPSEANAEGHCDDGPSNAALQRMPADAPASGMRISPEWNGSSWLVFFWVEHVVNIILSFCSDDDAQWSFCRLGPRAGEEREMSLQGFQWPLWGEPFAGRFFAIFDHFWI